MSIRTSHCEDAPESIYLGELCPMSIFKSSKRTLVELKIAKYHLKCYRQGENGGDDEVVRVMVEDAHVQVWPFQLSRRLLFQLRAHSRSHPHPSPPSPHFQDIILGDLLLFWVQEDYIWKFWRCSSDRVRWILSIDMYFHTGECVWADPFRFYKIFTNFWKFFCRFLGILWG